MRIHPPEKNHALADFGSDFAVGLVRLVLAVDFLATQLVLPLRDDFLGGIGILNDEVTGVARHHHGFRRSLGSFADFDHIGDVNEMIHSPFPYAFLTFSQAAVHSGSLSPRYPMGSHFEKTSSGGKRMGLPRKSSVRLL